MMSLKVTLILFSHNFIFPIGYYSLQLTLNITGEVKAVINGDFDYDGILDFILIVAPPKDKKNVIVTKYFLNKTKTGD